MDSIESETTTGSRYCAIQATRPSRESLRVGGERRRKLHRMVDAVHLQKWSSMAANLVPSSGLDYLQRFA